MEQYPFLNQNLKTKKKLEESRGRTLENCDMRSLGSDFRVYGGGCVNCGRYVTAQNLFYFGFDVERVLCYDCQKENADNQGWKWGEKIIK